ncbi:helix-turn-helix domain-containing protein [uncultured Aeromicrobium sp.]|uniref:helix-turn-helix domain-containing protein n=1 Tax=uncultured Aeromicrobium sp. TaxID=337820 RepID=UPI0025E70D76|nr:helix-turn-helix domain-containing protein [uncultured Aeromicrobium sp.]
MTTTRLLGTPADLGAEIRAARHRTGLTQADLAARAGVSRAWLIRLESGHPRAEIGAVLRVLDTLGLAITLTPDPDAPRPGRDVLIAEHVRAVEALDT